jgi:hypothetical protein
MSDIVYDCEIEKAIPDRREALLPGIEYCGGWRDFQGMGISVITTYDRSNGQSRIFLKDNLPEFVKLANNPNNRMLGFNNRNFDDQLVATIGATIQPERSVDLLRAIWVTKGLDPSVFNPRTHGGYGLNACARTNLGEEKSGTGVLAPIEWQRGNRGAVIDYCMRDTLLTYRLFVKAQGYTFIDPKTNTLLSLDVF